MARAPLSSGLIAVVGYALAFAISILGAPRWTGWAALVIAIVATVVLVFTLDVVQRRIPYTITRKGAPLVPPDYFTCRVEAAIKDGEALIQESAVSEESDAERLRIESHRWIANVATLLAERKDLAEHFAAPPFQDNLLRLASLGAPPSLLLSLEVGARLRTLEEIRGWLYGMSAL